MLVDFHSHTVESDGSLTPEELVARMIARGVKTFSITDHDSTGAYARLDLAAIAADVVVGVEINTTYRGNEVHILGYGLPLGPSPLAEMIDGNRTARATRAQEMVVLLQRSGFDITIADVRAQGIENVPLGRPHVAKALVAKGIAGSVDAAFRDFLSAGKAAYVPSQHIRPHDAVAAIARSGGVPVLAHPGRLKDERIIDEMALAGIAGLEVFYPTHRPAQVAFFRGKAREFGLVMTAGSDFHDPRWNTSGVGMDVDADDIEPFLALLS